MFGLRSSKSELLIYLFYLDCIKLASDKYVKSLDVIFDVDLSLDFLIEQVCILFAFLLRNIAKIVNILSRSWRARKPFWSLNTNPPNSRISMVSIAQNYTSVTNVISLTFAHFIGKTSGTLNFSDHWGKESDCDKTFIYCANFKSSIELIYRLFLFIDVIGLELWLSSTGIYITVGLRPTEGPVYG